MKLNKSKYVNIDRSSNTLDINLNNQSKKLPERRLHLSFPFRELVMFLNKYIISQYTNSNKNNNLHKHLSQKHNNLHRSHRRYQRHPILPYKFLQHQNPRKQLPLKRLKTSHRHTSSLRRLWNKI